MCVSYFRLGRLLEKAFSTCRSQLFLQAMLCVFHYFIFVLLECDFHLLYLSFPSFPVFRFTHHLLILMTSTENRRVIRPLSHPAVCLLALSFCKVRKKGFCQGSGWRNTYQGNEHTPRGGEGGVHGMSMWDKSKHNWACFLFQFFSAPKYRIPSWIYWVLCAT